MGNSNFSAIPTQRQEGQEERSELGIIQYHQEWHWRLPVNLRKSMILNLFGYN